MTVSISDHGASPVSIGEERSTEWGVGDALLLAAAFFVPFRILQVGQANFLFSDVLFAGAAGMLILRKGPLLPFDRPLSTQLWLSGVVVMSSSLMVSSLVNGDPARGLIVVGQFLFALLLVPGALARLAPWLAPKLAASYLLGMGVVCGVGIVLYTFYPAQASGFMFGGRMASFLGDPNALSKTVALTIPLAIVAWVDRILPRSVAIAVLICLVGCAMVAASFSGFITAVVATAVVVALSGHIAGGVKMVLVLVVATNLYLAAFGLPASVERRVLPVILAGQLSEAPNYQGRVQGILAAMDDVDGSLVGVGADMVQAESSSGKGTHNAFLLMWIEGGTLALLGLVFCLLALFNEAWVTWIGWSRLVGSAFIGTASAFVVAAMTNTHMYNRFWYLPLFVLASLSLWERERQTTE